MVVEGLVYFTVDEENCRVAKKKKTTAKAEGGKRERDVLSLAFWKDLK